MQKNFLVLLALLFCGTADAGQYLNITPQPQDNVENSTQGLGTLGYGMNNQTYPSYLYPRGPYSGYGPGNGYYPYSNFPNWPYYAY